MRETVFAFLIAATLPVSFGCSSREAQQSLDAGSSDAGASDAGSASMDAGRQDAGADSGPADASVPSDAGATIDASATVDGATIDASATDFTVEIIDPVVYGNCFGAVGDPLLVFWTARVVGAAGETIYTSQAKLTVTSSITEEQDLVVDVDEFVVPVSGSIEQMQRKTSGTPSVPICTYCDMTVGGSLSMTFTSSGGASHTVTQDVGSIGCVF